MCMFSVFKLLDFRDFKGFCCLWRKFLKHILAEFLRVSFKEKGSRCVVLDWVHENKGDIGWLFLQELNEHGWVDSDHNNQVGFGEKHRSVCELRF